MKTTRALHDHWTLRALSGPVPPAVAGRELAAEVPGCATTDLLAAGLVPDPYLDTNEGQLAWVGDTEWLYRTQFEAAPPAEGERVDLVFDGLDTVATVRLNGTVLGQTANMHRSYRFDLSAYLREGANELAVTFAAPVASAREASSILGERPCATGVPFNGIRKMACNFGWDWGPALPTSGIWRPVRLERWRTARIAAVRPLTTVTPLGDGLRGDVVVSAQVDLECDGGSGGETLVVTASVAGVSASAEVVAGASRAVLELRLPDAPLWWPVGYGDQPLEQLDVRLDLSGRDPGRLDAWARRIGFRSVVLDTSADDAGTRMALVVNGRRLMARGFNWIPADCFPSRVGRGRYERGLADAVGANANLVRVWGGGIYEDDEFYDVADELGVMVWQDFAFACAAYAEEEPLRSEVEAEAREAVTRLCPHPSLVLWNGCNENLMGFEDWGWKGPLRGRTWGAGYYWEVLPAIVAELDPTRPYTAGSPWSAGTSAHPNDPRHASVHIWDVWNGEDDYPKYRRYRPRFVAEFGFQGPPAWATLRRAVHDEPLTPASPGMLAHEKCVDGLAKLERWAGLHLPVPASTEDWHWATSLNQARAVSFGIDWWRSITPRCEGTVIWQLNDCWPVISWAAVDGDGRRKPLWYAVRRSYADCLLTVQPEGEGLVAAMVNDGLSTWSAGVVVARQDFWGAVLARATFRAEVAPGSVGALTLTSDVAVPADPAREVLVVRAGDHRALWFWREDKDLRLPEPSLAAEVTRAGDGFEVTLTAPSLQKDVSLLVDKVDPDATVDDMLVTLLPGEARTFHVRTSADIEPRSLLRRGVLRSVNQLAYPSA